MLSFKNQWDVPLVNTFYNINLTKSFNECHVTLIYKRYHAIILDNIFANNLNSANCYNLLLHFSVKCDNWTFWTEYACHISYVT